MNDDATRQAGSIEIAPSAATYRLVDIHCHCLPGIDDGPRDLEESVALCKALVKDGFDEIVATPHQLGRYQGINTKERILDSLSDIRRALDEQGVPLEIHTGADVRIDSQLESLVLSGEALTINDARQYLLLELPHEFFVDPTPVFEAMERQGVRTILTHPERYRYLAGALEPVEAWQGQGAIIQVTAGSLLGDFGRTAYAYSWRLVHGGVVDVIATDAHNLHRRPPRMQAAIERLDFEVGKTEANRLCRENPRRILRGEALLACGGANS